jgi:protein SCO1/2
MFHPHLLSPLLRRIRPQTLAFSTSSTSPRKLSSPVGWSAVGLLIGFGGLSIGYYTREREKARERVIQQGTASVGKPLLGGPFTLVNDKGQVVTDKSLFPENSKTFGLLYFGFTHCPDICPSEMVKMTKVVEEIEAQGFVDRLLPIFITVDPKRDGVAQVAHYVKDFHPKTIGLTGTPQQIASVCKQYRVYHVPQEASSSENEDEEYLVDHSIVIYLLAPDGSFLDFFTQLTEPKEIVERIKKRIVEAGK